MRKHPPKRAPKKLKSKRKSRKISTLTIASVIVSILIISTLVGGYYYLDKKEIVIDIQKDEMVQIKEKEEPKPITYEEKTKALEIEYANNVDNNVYLDEQDKKEEPTPFRYYEEPDIGEVDKVQPEPIVIKPEQKPIVEDKKVVEEKSILDEAKPYKPKLAIIIDDVTTSRQVNRILDIGYPVNMAFLPPASNHRNSAKVAQVLDNYMIHLPLQASSSRYEEEDTLYITDSVERIDKKIASLKKIYPKAKYINNHTGSKFTANKQAMDKLFSVLKKHDYLFVDSRTTAKSVAAQSAKKYGVKMLSRNIFLDNKKDKKYIQKQLKKAIKLAHKYGIAIAIGHPYKITFKTLKDSEHLLKDLELVYIDSL